MLRMARPRHNTNKSWTGTNDSSTELWKRTNYYYHNVDCSFSSMAINFGYFHGVLKSWKTLTTLVLEHYSEFQIPESWIEPTETSNSRSIQSSLCIQICPVNPRTCSVYLRAGRQCLSDGCSKPHASKRDVLPSQQQNHANQSLDPDQEGPYSRDHDLWL